MEASRADKRLASVLFPARFIPVSQTMNPG